MNRDEQIISEAKKHYYDDINCHNAFLHGVEWADEHPVDVWHDASEMPKEEEWILIQFDEDSYDALVFCDMNAAAFCTCCKKYGSTRWAYISDLLPKNLVTWQKLTH